MSTMKPKEEGPIEKAVVQCHFKLDTAIEEIRKLRVDVATIPRSTMAIWLFAALNFVINCGVLIVLYANLHP